MTILALDRMESGTWRRPISLEVRSGEILLILGRNGAGKTTLLNTVAGLLPVQSGRILWMERAVTDDDERGRIECGIRIGLEGRQVFGRLSVQRNLLLGAFTRRHREEIELDLEWVLNVFPDLRQKLHQEARSLSGGQQTMVSVARALMGRPRLLLLDEPTLGLDPQNTNKLIRALRQIQSERGVTALVAEQSGKVARAFPDRVALLVGGQVLFNGSLGEAERCGRLREVFA